jgi:hypothetical protein
MAQDANIGINLGGDATDLIKALKLAKNSVGDFQKKTREAINTAGKFGVAAAAAGAAIATTLFKATVDAADEIERLSRVAGVSVEVFQDMAAGAAVFGVEQDKLSDILKDVNDKVGDFLTTGGGAMADYFETIAPKIGQTAEEFRNLSGKDALQKYVNGLEEANVSQAEMTFFMEAIASDATMLLPLLKNNGKEFDRIAASVDNFGGALSAVEIDQLQKVKQSMTETSIVIKNLINKVMAKFAPIVTELSKRFNEAGDSVIDFGSLASNTFQAVGDSVGFVGNAMRGIEVVIKGLEVVFLGFKSAVLTIVAGIASAQDFIITRMHKNINKAIEKINSLPGIDIDKIVFGQSQSSSLNAWKEETINALIEAKAEMHNLAMEEMPADAIKNWMTDVVEASNTATAAILANRNAVNSLRPEDIEGQATLLTADMDSYNQRLLVMKNYGDEMKQEAQKQAADLISVQEQKKQDSIGIASSMFSNLSTLMNTESKKMFEIGKVAAIAGAVVDGISAAVSSYKFGASIGGPLVGGAFAASSVVATGAMISNLKSRSFSGGGSASVPTGGGSPSVPQQQGQAQTVNRTVTIDGIQDLDSSAFTSGGTLTALFDIIRDAQRNGEQVII